MKRLEKIAKKIIELEKKCQEEGPLPEYLTEMESLSKNLSFEDLLFIDEYILEKTDLKK
jgi:hypothetical protein